MAYDEQLAARVRRELAGADEKRMFGGLAFMLHGHMCCGIVGQDLMVRVGPDRHERALARPHSRPMDFTGRPMNGMVFVGPEGTRTEASLRAWIGEAVEFARTLPPKPHAASRHKPGAPR